METTHTHDSIILECDGPQWMIANLIRSIRSAGYTAEFRWSTSNRRTVVTEHPVLALMLIGYFDGWQHVKTTDDGCSCMSIKNTIKQFGGIYLKFESYDVETELLEILVESEDVGYVTWNFQRISGCKLCFMITYGLTMDEATLLAKRIVSKGLTRCVSIVVDGSLQKVVEADE